MGGGFEDVGPGGGTGDDPCDDQCDGMTAHLAGDRPHVGDAPPVDHRCGGGFDPIGGVHGLRGGPGRLGAEVGLVEACRRGAIG